MKKVLIITLTYVIILSLLPVSLMVEATTINQSEGYICIRDCSTNTNKYYMALLKDGIVFLEGNDVAEITGYSLGRITVINEAENTEIVKPNFYRGSTAMAYDVKSQCFDYRAEKQYGVSQEMKVESIRHMDKNYYRLDKMLYLMHTQWFIENDVLNVYPAGNTLIEFLDQNMDYILDNSAKHSALLMNGENGTLHSARIVLSKLLDDCDMRIFLPFGNTLIMKDIYRDAILQLAVEDDRFLDGQGQAAISSAIDGSTFNQIKTNWDAIAEIHDMPLNISDVVDFMGESDATKFSIWNDPSLFDTTDMQAKQKELGVVSDIIDLVGIVVSFNETLNRSKAWGESFIRELDILTLDPTTQNIFGDNGKYIHDTVTKLKEEKENTLETATENAMIQVTSLLIEKAVDLVIPVGKLKAVVSAGVAILKTAPTIATRIDDAALMNTVHALINVEEVAIYQVADSYYRYGDTIHVTMLERFWNDNDSNSWISGDIKERQQAIKIAYLRACTNLLLRTTLRNKIFVYRFNADLNNTPNWVNMSEAKAMREDIYKTYALMIELNNTEDYDRVLLVNTDFTNLISDAYGAMRSPITTTVFKEEIEDTDNADITDTSHGDVSLPLTYETARQRIDEYYEAANPGVYADEQLEFSSEYVIFALRSNKDVDYPDALFGTIKVDLSSGKATAEYTHDWAWMREYIDLVTLTRIEETDNDIVRMNTKIELSQYMNQDFFDFVDMIGDMHDAGATDENIEYTNGIVTVTALWEWWIDVDQISGIHFLSIDDECGYSICGVSYGENLQGAVSRLHGEGWNYDLNYLKSGTDPDITRLVNDSGYSISLHSESGTTVTSISYFAPQN